MSVDFGSKPQQMILVNMVTGDARTPQFNPTDFEEAIGANFADLVVPGLSHSVKHFINTINTKFSFELFYRGNSADGISAIMDDRKFLYALTHPWRSDGIDRGGPPRVQFIWPKFISLTCYLTGCTFKYTQFNKDAQPTAYSAKITLEEVRDIFVGMDDILANGTQRVDVPTFDEKSSGDER